MLQVTLTRTTLTSPSLSPNLNPNPNPNQPELEPELEPEPEPEPTPNQAALLRNGFRQLREGGVLVYSTCSFARSQAHSKYSHTVAHST